MAIETIKFSEMASGGDLANNDMTPGLQGSLNVLFNNPWTFLPPGTTAERPAPSPAINFRLRFNTDDQFYEYYDSVLSDWVQLQENSSGVESIQGTENQVLVNGTFGIPQTGALTLTTPQDIAPASSPTFNNLTLTGSSIFDINNNPILRLSPTVSAVNYIGILNNSTGNNPTIVASGSDSDVGLSMITKGLGSYVLSTLATTEQVSIYTGSGLQHLSIFNYPSTAATQQYTWPDDTGTIALTTDLSGYLPLAGGTMSGSLFLSGAPTEPNEASSKSYVDTVAAGLAPAGPVDAADTSNFSATYFNGPSNDGVGATLTATSTGVVTIDSVSVTLGQDYLFAGQTDETQNGIYICTTLGAIGVAAIFTRSTRYDSPGDINNTGLIPVINGSSNGGRGFYETNTITAIGVDDITYSQFGNMGTVTSITAGTGLTGGTITGTGTIALDIPVSIANGGTNSTTASGARTSLSAAQLGANTDITSLGSTNFTTPGTTKGVATTAGHTNVTGQTTNVYTCVFETADSHNVGSVYNASTGVLTINTAGFWIFNSGIIVDGIVSDNNFGLIYINASSSTPQVSEGISTSAPFVMSGSVGILVTSMSMMGYFPAGATVQVRLDFRGHASNNVNLDAGSYFSWRFIG